MTKPTATPAEQLPPPTAQHQLLPLASLRESPMNHRRTWGDMDELVESVRRQGVLQPVLARPVGEAAWEIVFGHRRYRAAKKAGLAQLPAMVRQMTDFEVLEAQVVENCQRQDIHPMEEAEGFAALLEEKQRPITVDEIAAKVGKSKAYVYGRLKLAALCPEARKAFYGGDFSASVALLVARMPPPLQTKALRELRRFGDRNDPVSFRRAVDVVHRDFMLDLKGATFDPADAGLLPAAGACSACPKRSGANPDLFGDVKGGDVCSDPTCFHAKADAAWKRTAAEAEAKGRKVLSEKETKACFPHGSYLESRAGYVDLADHNYRDPKHRTWKQLIGRAAKDQIALARDDRGKVHELVPASSTAKLLRDAGHNFKTERQRGTAAADRAATEKERERQAVEGEVEKRAALLLGAALDSKEPNRDVWDCAIDALLSTMYGDADQVLVRRFGPDDPEKAFEKARPKMTALQLRAVFLDLHLSSEIGAFRSKVSGRLFEWAGVDVKKIEAQVRADRKAAAEEKARPIAWTDAKDGAATGKAARDRVYTIEIDKTPLYPRGKGFSWSVNSSGVGAAGSGPFRTIEEAKRSAEKGEAERLARASPAGKVAHD